MVLAAAGGGRRRRAAVLLLIGALLPGRPPAFDDSALKIVSFFRDNHKKELIAAVLVEIGVAMLVGVVAQLAVLLRDAEKRAHAAVVAFSGEAGAVAPLYRLILFMQVAWFWTTLVMVVALAHAAWTGAFARWVAPVNGVVAVLLLLGGISVKGTGALAAGTGALCLIGSIAFLVWVAQLAVLFWARTEEAPAAVASPV